MEQEVLPIIEPHTAGTSALHIAVDAFALANIQGFTITDGDLRSMAMRKYGEALAAVRKSIASDDLKFDDSILLAILPIDIFEVGIPFGQQVALYM